MSRFAITTVYDEPSRSIRAFEDITRVLYHSLESMGHSVAILRNEFSDDATNIVFGTHLTNRSKEIPRFSIVFNTEQLDGDIPEKWRNRIIRASLVSGRAWDLSSRNLKTLEGITSDQVRLGLFRLGYHAKAALDIKKTGNSLGVVHIGSMTSYRKTLFETIRPKRAIINCFTGFYGQERDAIVAEARFVLCTHSQSSRILEWPRINFLLHSNTPFLILERDDTYKEPYQKEFSSYELESLGSERLDHLWDNPAELMSMANKNKESFLKLDQDIFTEEALEFLGIQQEQTAKEVTHDMNILNCRRDGEIDARWYQTVYPMAYSDPRDLKIFHYSEGRKRQFHTNRNFHQNFSRPKSIDELLSECCDSKAKSISGLRRARIAACMHFHSPDRLKYFFALFAPSLPRDTELYVTVTSPALAALTIFLAQESEFRTCKVVEIGNRGRDIPSKYIVFAKDLAHADICLYTHGKESDPHWFHTCNASICGSVHLVERIIDCFTMDQSLGLLMPDYMPYLRPSIGWGSMRGIIEEILNSFLLSTNQIEFLEFPAGGFFWARPRAVAPICELKLEISKLPSEPVQKDGTILHAIERMPCITAEIMGYRWDKIELDYTV